MDPVTIYGVGAPSFMMLMNAFERRDALFILAFAFGCALASAYGFLSGAWPFGWSKSSGAGSPCAGSETWAGQERADLPDEMRSLKTAHWLLPNRCPVSRLSQPFPRQK